MRSRLIYLLLIMLSGSILPCNGQTDTTAALYSNQPFIRYYDTLINVKLKVHTDYETFEQTSGSNYHVDLRPNMLLSTKIGVSYRFISFGFGFSPAFLPGNNETDLKGKTRSWSFGIGTTGRIIQEANIGYVKGFYLKNTGELVPGWVEGQDPYLQVPDLTVIMLNGATGFKFNRNYSISAQHSQTQAQLRSAGSFIPILSYDYYAIDNKPKTGSVVNSQLSGNLRLIANFGYAYTFVFARQFYLAAFVQPGIGLQHTKLITRTIDGDLKNRYNDPLFRMQEKIGLGYQGDRFFGGLEGFFSQSWINENNNAAQLKTNRIYYQFFVGYRFNTPKFVRKSTDAVKGVIPRPIRNIIE